MPDENQHVLKELDKSRDQSMTRADSTLKAQELNMMIQYPSQQDMDLN